MKYFKNVKDVKELKKAYFKFVKMYHTDNGGNKEDFVEMKAEYEKIIKENLFAKTQENEERKTEYNRETMQKFADIIDKIISFDIDIEIIGDWIWVGGNTYAYKEELKEYHFFFSRGKKKWYWNGEDKKIKKYSKMSLDEIKSKYGCTKVKNKKIDLLTC